MALIITTTEAMMATVSAEESVLSLDLRLSDPAIHDIVMSTIWSILAQFVNTAEKTEVTNQAETTENSADAKRPKALESIKGPKTVPGYMIAEGYEAAQR